MGFSLGGLGKSLGGMLGGGAELAGGATAAYGAYQNKEDIEKWQKDKKQLSERNLGLQKEGVAQNRGYGNYLLDASRPDMNAAGMGNLLYKQGEEAYSKQHAKDLATVLGQNMRQGMPMSAADITSRFAGEAGSERADRRSNATLQGIMNTMASPAGIQAAAGLFNQAPVQQSDYLGATPVTPQGNFTQSLGNSMPSFMQSAMGVASSAAPLLGMFSDRRLKRDIIQVGNTDHGLPVYTFKYHGDDVTHMGVMADEAEQAFPDAVFEVNGYKAVDYSKIG